jgi:hypothetical protein
MTYFKEKYSPFSKGDLKIFGHKTAIKEGTAQNEEKCVF